MDWPHTEETIKQHH